VTEFLDTLENLSLSQWVSSSPSKLAYPTILWLHVMGMGVVAGGIDLQRIAAVRQSLPAYRHRVIG